MIMHSVWLMSAFFFLLAISAVLVRGSNATIASAKPGCQSRCGDREIPYPFGIGPNCSWNENFNVYCDNPSQLIPPKLYLFIPSRYGFDLEIVNISESQIYVKDLNMQLAMACYDNETVLPYATRDTVMKLDFSNTPYTISEANRITAIGCDDLVIGSSLIRNTKVTTTCVSCCQSSEEYVGGITFESCPGRGYCRTTISKGDSLKVQLLDLHSTWRKNKIYNCSFAFIGMTDEIDHQFTFRLRNNDDRQSFLNDKDFTDKPLVLDWRINSANCSGLRPEKGCQENSYCHDMDDGFGGLRCMCKKGYQGNPYISPGCHDINECDYNPCILNVTCINTQGSYRCLCPHGYYGDGTRLGSGCIPEPASNFKLILGVGLGAGMGLLLLSFMCFQLCKFMKKRRGILHRRKFFREQMLMHEGILERIRLFTVKELERATDNFNESRIVGQGGQGTVYKGMLPDGRTIAVKRSRLVDESQVEQFINEVVMLSQINHRNVVKLLGCCLEKEVLLLVYEFISNGTLFDHIHDEVQEFPFLWSLRLKTAVEVAEALTYLHSATSIPIYHRDIKSTNILLDEKYVAKVSDFGTSRSISVDQTHLTTLVKGTFGYLDPEYFQSSQFTEKSDVYSFGVVLVELLTGLRPISFDRMGEERNLATRFLICMLGNKLETIIDSQVLEQGKKEEVDAVAKLARGCLNLNGKNRPTMKQVAIELESIRTSKTLPKTCESKSQGTNLGKSQSMPMIANDICTIPLLDVCSSFSICTV